MICVVCLLSRYKRIMKCTSIHLSQTALTCITLILSVCTSYAPTRAQNKEAQWSIANYHRYYNQARAVKSPEKEVFIKQYRQVLQRQNLYFFGIERQYELDKLTALLQADGTFSDLPSTYPATVCIVPEKQR